MREQSVAARRRPAPAVRAPTSTEAVRSMRQLTFVSPGRLERREVAEPRIEAPDDAFVRPIAARLKPPGVRCLMRGCRPSPHHRTITSTGHTV